jgi:RIO kinase 1
MGSGLENLVAEGVITEVIARLQSGKEAEVYVVRFGGRVVAAKVYKDRDHRSFKNNASYMEGRSVRNSRSQRAMDRGTKFGKAAAEDAWKSAEADALYKLHAADVRVPTPVLFLDGVLLMELVLDGDGEPARRLIDTDLSAEQANAGYHDMLGQIVRILSCDLIHGDLSPYNVLWAAGGPTVIDFPQILSASHNSGSQRFFLRDAENILGHFARIDRTLNARRGDASEIWRAYVSRELTPDFRPTGRSRPPPPPPSPARLPEAKRVFPHAPRAQRPAVAPSVAPPAAVPAPFIRAAPGPTRPPVPAARPNGAPRRRPAGREVEVIVRRHSPSLPTPSDSRSPAANVASGVGSRMGPRVASDPVGGAEHRPALDCASACASTIEPRPPSEAQPSARRRRRRRR